MAELININDFGGIQKLLNQHLSQRPDSAAISIGLFNSILLDALHQYDRPETEVSDPSKKHLNMDLYTHKQFSISASPQQLQQQQELTASLFERNISQFLFKNALHTAALTLIEAEKTLPIEVVDNMPHKFNRNSQYTEVQSTLKHSKDVMDFIDVVEKSRAQIEAIG